VADFVANMSPLGVLTERDVMGPVTDSSATAADAETPVNELIQRLGESDQAIPITQDGRTIGTVTAKSIVEQLKSD